MSAIRKVAVAGVSLCHSIYIIATFTNIRQAGRIGGTVVNELVNAGFDVTVLTRNSNHQTGKSAKAKVVQVDYDSDSSLTEALRGQDAVVSTVAMSAIGNQQRMIDAAISAGVKYFIPAEYTVNSRDAAAQAQPMMASVVAIQQYLESKQGQIAWCVVNCGALMEFVFDHPILLDFDNHATTLWDGGDGAMSISDIPLLARAISAALQQPDKVVDNRLRVHGGTITQNRALELAKQHASHEWSVTHRESQETYPSAMQRLTSGVANAEGTLMAGILTLYTAAAFGRCEGHFEAVYADPDNEWLGVDTFSRGEVEEAIKKRVTVGSYVTQSGTGDQESLRDVTGDLAATFSKS